ncbi:MAG: hypothetical protein H0U84_01860 [Thermoleophilaceae bacterium]|nr:hypothetical protein [Thermoleophilaceae bacterium]
MSDDVRKIDIAFHGGHILSARVAGEDFQKLRAALGDERADRWFELRTQDSEISVDLSKVVYVRLDADAQHVGF